jgi:hypothetical protein
LILFYPKLKLKFRIKKNRLLNGGFDLLNGKSEENFTQLEQIIFGRLHGFVLSGLNR